ncbi:MAG: 2-oxoacid:acceptor oxidoreductase family protein [Candidatus Omnitrophota bacterium]
MVERIIIAGSGGQGIMLLGKIIAEAAMREDKFVTWLPSYGAEVRGGTAYCMIIISDQEIGSPYILKADTLIVLNEPSLLRFKGRLGNKGLLIADNSLIEDKSVQGDYYPFTDIAIKLGNVKVANVVVLGSFITLKKIVFKESALQAMQNFAGQDKKHLLEINQKALEAGISLSKK